MSLPETGSPCFREEDGNRDGLYLDDSILRACCLQPEEKYKWALTHVWSLETFRKPLKLSLRANIGLSPDLFTPPNTEENPVSLDYLQLPWIANWNFKYYIVRSTGMVGKISKFGGLKDSFYFSNLQMKCKFWSIGDLHKVTKEQPFLNGCPSALDSC